MDNKFKFQKVLLVSILILCGLGQPNKVTAGINVWTSNGPEGGSIRSLAIDPVTPTTLYAGTWYGGVFKSITAVKTGVQPTLA